MLDIATNWTVPYINDGVDNLYVKPENLKADSSSFERGAWSSMVLVGPNSFKANFFASSKPETFTITLVSAPNGASLFRILNFQPAVIQCLIQSKNFSKPMLARAPVSNNARRIAAESLVIWIVAEFIVTHGLIALPIHRVARSWVSRFIFLHLLTCS